MDGASHAETAAARHSRAIGMGCPDLARPTVARAAVVIGARSGRNCIWRLIRWRWCVALTIDDDLARRGAGVGYCRRCAEHSKHTADRPISKRFLIEIGAWCTPFRSRKAQGTPKLHLGRGVSNRACPTRPPRTTEQLLAEVYLSCCGTPVLDKMVRAAKSGSSSMGT